MLDRHVIKGRGENRGKYLRWHGMHGTPEWTPHQKLASRDSEHDARQYVTGRLFDGGPRAWTPTGQPMGGYIVKLTCPKSIDVDGLRSFICAHAGGAIDPDPCHRIAGLDTVKWRAEDRGNGGLWCDSATHFCPTCVEARVIAICAAHPEASVDVDGGYIVEYDSTPFCEVCGVKLEGSQTDYCTGEELEAITTYAAPDYHHANGWQELDDALDNIEDDHPVWRKIERIVKAAQAMERFRGGARATLTRAA